MALSPSSVLHYWSARHGAIPVIGGNPVHTRASTAKWFDQMGMAREAPVNTPRFEWATIASERRPVLRLEQARTNAFTYSEDLSQSVYVKNSCSITANATLAPDGTLTADKIVENGDVNVHHYIERDQPGVTGNTAQSFLCFAKAAGRDYVEIVLIDKAGTGRNARVRLTDGAVTASYADSNYVVTVSSCAHGWFGIRIRENTGTGAVTPKVQILMRSDDSQSAYTGNGVSGIYIWGVQFEVDKAAASGYIATGTSAVTRSADDCYWDFDDKVRGVAAYIRFVNRGSHLIPGAIVLHVGNGSAPHFTINVTAGGRFQVIHHNAVSQVANDNVYSQGVGNVVELLAYVTQDVGQDGKVRIIQSVDAQAVADSAETAPLVLASTWSARRANVNAVGASDAGLIDVAELKIVKFQDMVGGTAQQWMDELRAFELSPAGEAL